MASPGLQYSKDKGQDQWGLLDIDAAERIWQADNEAVKNDLIEATKSRDRTTCAFLPTAGVGAFQIHRSAEFIPGQPPVPHLQHWGVALVDASRGPKTFATWSTDALASIPTLIITRLRATPTIFPNLMRRIRQALDEDSVQGGIIKRIETWNLPTELEMAASELGGRTTQRNEHLPAFKWYGEEEEKDIEWLSTRSEYFF